MCVAVSLQKYSHSRLRVRATLRRIRLEVTLWLYDEHRQKDKYGMHLELACPTAEKSLS
jgi:hypothetical protein